MITALEDENMKVISCGDHHAGAVTANGDVWLWGGNDLGQLGTGDTQNYTVPHEAPSTFWNEEISNIKCGGKHTIVLSCTGNIYCFGDGSSGQLGVKVRTDTPYLTTPCRVPFPDLSKVLKIGCGAAHSAVITTNGSLFTWGKGAGGRLGHGDHRDRSSPELVEAMTYKEVQSVDCGANHTAVCVIRAWVMDEETKTCMACKSKFTTFLRRHHCRKCGGI